MTEHEEVLIGNEKTMAKIEEAAAKDDGLEGQIEAMEAINEEIDSRIVKTEAKAAAKIAALRAKREDCAGVIEELKAQIRQEEASTSGGDRQ